MCYFYYVTVLTFFLHCFVTTVACFSVSFLCLIKEKESLFLRLSSFCLSFSRMPVGYFFTFVASCQVVSFFIVKLSLSLPSNHILLQFIVPFPSTDQISLKKERVSCKNKKRFREKMFCWSNV